MFWLVFCCPLLLNMYTIPLTERRAAHFPNGPIIAGFRVGAVNTQTAIQSFSKIGNSNLVSGIVYGGVHDNIVEARLTVQIIEIKPNLLGIY